VKIAKYPPSRKDTLDLALFGLLSLQMLPINADFSERDPSRFAACSFRGRTGFIPHVFDLPGAADGDLPRSGTRDVPARSGWECRRGVRVIPSALVFSGLLRTGTVRAPNEGS